MSEETEKDAEFEDWYSSLSQMPHDGLNMVLRNGEYGKKTWVYFYSETQIILAQWRKIKTLEDAIREHKNTKGELYLDIYLKDKTLYDKTLYKVLGEE